MKMLRLALVLVFVLVAAGCTQQSQTSQEVKVKEEVTKPVVTVAATEAPIVEAISLSWTGCGISKKAFMGEAAIAYEASTGIKIELTGGGATKGVRSAAGGTSDLGGSCRMALPEYDEESNVLATHVAWDALVFITHKDNPVEGITTQQAKDIILGDITNWKEVGGPDEAIIPVFREQTASGKLSGVGHMTRVLLFNDPEKDFLETAIFKKSSGPVEEFVTETPYTFAVTGISSAKKRDIKIMTLDGVESSKENIGSGAYPLYRPLFILTKGEPTGMVLDFMDWILGDDGQKLISEQGTVNLKEGEGLKEKFTAWHDTDIIRNY